MAGGATSGHARSCNRQPEELHPAMPGAATGGRRSYIQPCRELQPKDGAPEVATGGRRSYKLEEQQTDDGRVGTSTQGCCNRCVPVLEPAISGVGTSVPHALTTLRKCWNQRSPVLEPCYGNAGTIHLRVLTRRLTTATAYGGAATGAMFCWDR